MKTYVKIMKKFHLPLLAIALVLLVYFGVNGVKAEFKEEEKTSQETLESHDLKIVAVDEENRNDLRTQELMNGKTETTNEKTINSQTTNPTPEVKNIPAPTLEVKKQKVTTKINASRRAGNYITDFKTGETAFDNLIKVAKGDIEYTEWGGDLGVFVDCIGGLCRTDGYEYFWSLYINGKLSMVGAGAYIVNPNDVIEWKYTEAEFRY